MKNLKLSIVFDSVFIFISAFFMAFALIRYNGGKFITSLIFSILISLVLAFLYLIFIILNKDKCAIKLDDENKINYLKTELCFMDNQSLLSLFLSFYNKLKVNAIAEKDYLIIEENKCQTFLLFNYEKTESNKVIDCYKRTKRGYSTVILSNEYTLDALNLVNDLSLRIKLFDLKSVYVALKSQDLLPKITVPKKVNSVSFIDKMKGVFKKSNGKKALTLGVIIILSARFSFYPIYYIIFGGGLIIFSIILRFWGKKETQPSKTEKLSLS